MPPCQIYGTEVRDVTIFQHKESFISSLPLTPPLLGPGLERGWQWSFRAIVGLVARGAVSISGNGGFPLIMLFLPTGDSWVLFSTWPSMLGDFQWWPPLCGAVSGDGPKSRGKVKLSLRSRTCSPEFAS